MTEKKKQPAEQDLDLEQFGAGKKLKKGLIIAGVAAVAVLLFLAARMLAAGISFKNEMAKYDTATIITLKDPADPAKQCRCLEMKEGLGYLTMRFGMSMVFDGPKQECGYDSLVTFANSAEQYTLSVSTRCDYIKYPPTSEFPSGESRNYSKLLVRSYLDAAHDNGVDCDCID